MVLSGVRRAYRRRHRTATAPRRPTLRDPGLQAAFTADGFVVVDLVDQSCVADLRRRYDGLEHLHQAESPWVDGFETTLYDPRREYRAHVLADAEDVLGPALDRVLVEHRVMFANYVVKRPGAATVPPHADWTFLDESRYSSVTAWCPLVDATAARRNGALGVVVGSQERIDFLRVANVPCYDRCVDAVSDLEHRVLDLRAGQALIMDNRVVHFSEPNRTGDERVALGCVLGPAEADLHHYWRDPDDQLLRFRLDRSFYLGYEIGRPDEAAGVLGVEIAEDVAVP